MTKNETIYQHICTMLREYDQHTGSRGADNVIAHPDKWIDNRHFPFYASAAALLVECRAKMETKPTSRTVSAAISRILKNPLQVRTELKGLFPHNDKFVACDGYRLVRLTSDIPGLPHTESSLDVARLMDRFPLVNETLPLPTIAELRALLAEDKAKNGKRNRKGAPCTCRLEGGICVNAQYLLDMLQALPGCRVYKPESLISPIYFAADNGNDGILLPVRCSNTSGEDAA